ncbi:ATP-dependent DNA helicase PIF1-like [Chenopodium quinoa]|uniref:ATP-dependent DNA helicase PIF1-like n=1 Tax=Chenopodium quinoa TaxID=63459 RepID=UPI000B780215|nr:ATP-dependent DNA helicase PIF1-like [Chenopodium quinoa]
MARKENIESVELLLRDLCDPDQPFGGKVIVFGGDFRQVLPVVPHKTQREVVATSLVTSHIWPWLQKLHLTENIRAKADPPYASFLLAVAAFPELQHPAFTPDIFTERAILTPLNDAVDSINNFLIDKFPGEAVVYKSFDSILDDNCVIYPTEFLNQLAPGGMTPHGLVLKVNSPVILLRNIDPADGLCNGTRLICKYFRRNVIVCSIAIGHRKGELVFIHRVNLRPPSSAKYPIQFEHIQFPLKLSFAMTINKSQGKTLSQVMVYLPQPCFSHGQLYVALSRAKKSEKVTVITPSLLKFTIHQF